MPNLTHTFKHHGKTVHIGKFDSSEPDKVVDLKWSNIHMIQHVFDQLEDSKRFTSNELEELAELDRKTFRSKIERIK